MKRKVKVVSSVKSNLDFEKNFLVLDLVEIGDEPFVFFKKDDKVVFKLSLAEAGNVKSDIDFLLFDYFLMKVKQNE